MPQAVVSNRELSWTQGCSTAICNYIGIDDRLADLSISCWIGRFRQLQYTAWGCVQSYGDTRWIRVNPAHVGCGDVRHRPGSEIGLRNGVGSGTGDAFIEVEIVIQIANSFNFRASDLV